MPSLDLAMPLALFIVVMVALLLNKRVEGKLMATVEKKEFRSRDIILLVGLMSIIISVLAYTSLLNPGAIVENILLVMFLTSYSTLLFTFSYVFSNVSQTRVSLLSVGFGLVSAVTGIICLFPTLQDSFTVVRIAAFFGLAIFCFGVAFYEQGKNVIAKTRWYLAVQPPAMFLFLFIFFNFINNSGTASIWAPFLMDVFGFTFAILNHSIFVIPVHLEDCGAFCSSLNHHGYYSGYWDISDAHSCKYVYWTWASSACVFATNSS